MAQGVFFGGGEIKHLFRAAAPKPWAGTLSVARGAGFLSFATGLGGTAMKRGRKKMKNTRHY